MAQEWRFSWHHHPKAFQVDVCLVLLELRQDIGTLVFAFEKYLDVWVGVGQQILERVTVQGHKFRQREVSIVTKLEGERDNAIPRLRGRRSCWQRRVLGP